MFHQSAGGNAKEGCLHSLLDAVAVSSFCVLKSHSKCLAALVTLCASVGQPKALFPFQFGCFIPHTRDGKGKFLKLYPQKPFDRPSARQGKCAQWLGTLQLQEAVRGRGKSMRKGESSGAKPLPPDMGLTLLTLLSLSWRTVSKFLCSPFPDCFLRARL